MSNARVANAVKPAVSGLWQSGRIIKYLAGYIWLGIVGYAAGLLLRSLRDL